MVLATTTATSTTARTAPSAAPAPAPARPRRLDFLDGLRGLAAVQVVALHYAAAFLPGLGTQDPGLVHYGWELPLMGAPYFFLIDGTFSVYLFFAISGTVLTLAFGLHPLALGSAVLKRVVRLGIPMAASLACAACLLSVWPGAHGEAAALSNSYWLGGLMTAPTGVTEVLREALGSGMVLGYRETSVLPEALWTVFPSDGIGHTLNPPLWSLHLEFWGSVLVAALTALRHLAPPRVHLAIVLGLAALLSRHPLVPFVAGHLFALAWQSPGWRSVQRSTGWRIVGAVALAAGVWACTNPPWRWVSAWLALPGPFRLWSGDTHLQSLYAALLFFAGTMLFPPLWRLLRSRPVQALGRNSFGLYLVHFPILFTVGAATFAGVRSHVPYAGAVLIATLAGLVPTAVATLAFTRLVDAPSMRLSRLVALPSLRRPAPPFAAKP